MLLSTRLESIGERRLRVARLGEGPALLLLHGYPDNLQIFSALAAKLAARFEVFAFDWPGLGDSEPWSGGATPMALAKRIAALLDHWKLERAHLFGFDMGGQPALCFAADFPDRIDRLIVSNSLVMGDEATSWEIRILRRFGFNRLIISRLPGSVFRRCERTFLPKGSRLDPELRAELWERFKKREVRQTVVRMCAGYEAQLSRLPERYRRVRAPTLLLWGEHDSHFPPIHAEKLAALLSDAEVRVVADGTHWMVWHRAEEIANEVARFLSISAPGHGSPKSQEPVCSPIG